MDESEEENEEEDSEGDGDEEEDNEEEEAEAGSEKEEEARLSALEEQRIEEKVSIRVQGLGATDRIGCGRWEASL